MSMIANKKHEMIEYGCVYVGKRWRRRVNGRAKIGTNEKNDPKGRAQNIRSKGEKDFQIEAFVQIKNCTKARLEYIESYVRMHLENDGYVNVGNDHFEFCMEDSKIDYQKFVDRAIYHATEGCKKENFEYTVIYEKR